MGADTGVRPVKVTVLGGGVAGLAAAFELSDPRHGGRFQVTLHQLGWRLGGKCASGRDLDTALRTKEHGPHIFFGFYDNAFAVLREAYTALAADPARVFPTIEDALVAHNSLATMEQQDDGSWLPWVIDLPTLPGRPGDGLPQPQAQALDALMGIIERNATELVAQQAPGPNALHSALIFSTLATVKLQADALIKASPEGREAGTAPFAHGLKQLQGAIQAARPGLAGQSVSWRRLKILADLAIATAIGMALDNLIWPTRQSVAAANEFEYRAWLLRHGALSETANSAIVRAMYDTVFAYPGGDVNVPGNVEAGSAVLTQKGLISYRGAPSYKMRTGTGDVTAAPLYQVLVQRGVTVNFFHRVDELIPAADGTIESIRIGVQATANPGGYQPLINVKGVPAWPDRPLYNQLVQGDALREGHIDLESFWTPWVDPVPPIILSRSAGDFDAVVLAIPVGALGNLATKLTQPSWLAMLAGSSTVRTQSVQVWLNRDTGWSTGAAPVVTGYDRASIDTWLDASEVIPFEDWPAPAPVHMAILCGPLVQLGAAPPPSDHAFPGAEAAVVANGGQQFLNAAAPLWPALTSANGFDWSALTAPATSSGPLRFQAQYWGAAINPGDRYVLTLVGSSKTRLQPGASGYANLYLAGDWTDYGLNLGCFEGAVMSGLMAANAITGDPRPILRNPFDES
ncbi:flavin-dependent amine oxidoreductase [Bradyrhizobium macuxiense]|uniref:Flavin-dependent amine oxidoreductase n=1 Tax=Bradyrhizobium macuxiense TaxID=1755647 RepID=A0A560KV80_9BRAD|nr:FAD-dependent oxidoreductase [Bradyrhizobium macuxiense]TWB87153.1 flavin-dependent amine oxidoreductase [Bradyrhizobium macuxiense]